MKNRYRLPERVMFYHPNKSSSVFLYVGSDGITYPMIVTNGMGNSEVSALLQAMVDATEYAIEVYYGRP